MSDNPKTVYTYYEPVPLIDQKEQQQQIDCCRQSWEHYGWNFVVLNQQHAAQHPWFKLYSIAIESLPSACPAGYDYNCFLRWLAMVTVGGGLMIDYDVMNAGVADLNFFSGHSQLTIYQQYVPCVVYGTAEQYLAVCELFFRFATSRIYIVLENGVPHVSDMHMIMSGFDHTVAKRLNVVADYPSKKPLIHCSYNCTTRLNKNRLQVMQEILNHILTTSAS